MHEDSLVEGMKELMPVYCVIGKIPVCREEEWAGDKIFSSFFYMKYKKSACPRQKNKFSLLHEKGELVNSMYIRKADFLKEDLHAYDNDISYGDIWISIFISLQKKSTSTMRSASWLVDFLVVIRKLFGSSKNIMSANRQKHKALISDIPQRTLSAFQTEWCLSDRKGRCGLRRG